MTGDYWRDPVYLAEHGVAAWCPDWCRESHGPVQIIAPDGVGVTHNHAGVQVGKATAYYSRWESVDDGDQEHFVMLEHVNGGRDGYDGYLQIPLSAVADVIAALQRVPVPDTSLSDWGG